MKKAEPVPTGIPACHEKMADRIVSFLNELTALDSLTTTRLVYTSVPMNQKLRKLMFTLPRSDTHVTVLAVLHYLAGAYGNGALAVAAHPGAENITGFQRVSPTGRAIGIPRQKRGCDPVLFRVDYELVDLSVLRMGELLRADRMGVTRLLNSRTPCIRQFAEHPTLQATFTRDRYLVGLLGLINGICGIYTRGGRGGFVAIEDTMKRGYIGFARADHRGTSGITDQPKEAP